MSLSSEGPGTITETSMDMNAEKDSDLPTQNCQDTYHFTVSNYSLFPEKVIFADFNLIF